MVLLHTVGCCVLCAEIIIMMYNVLHVRATHKNTGELVSEQSFSLSLFFFLRLLLRFHSFFTRTTCTGTPVHLLRYDGLNTQPELKLKERMKERK